MLPIVALALLIVQVSAPPASDLPATIEAALNPPNSYGYRTPKAGKSVVSLGGQTFTLAAPWRLNAASDLIIDGQGATIIADFDAPEDVIVDLTGSRFCQLRDLRIRAASGRKIGSGLLAARPLSAASAGFHQFRYVQIDGAFEYATATIWASECNLWDFCYFVQRGPGSIVVISDGGEPGALANCKHGRSTMLEQTFRDCYFDAGDSKAGSDSAALITVMKTNQSIVGDIEFFGGGGCLSRPRPAVFSIENNGSPGQTDGLSINGMRWETGPARHFMRCRSDSSSRDFTRIAIRDSVIQCQYEAVMATGMTLSNWTVQSIKSGPQTGSPYGNYEHRYAVICDAMIPMAAWPLGRQSYLYSDQWAPKSNATFELKANALGIPQPAPPTTAKP